MTKGLLKSMFLHTGILMMFMYGAEIFKKNKRFEIYEIPLDIVDISEKTVNKIENKDIFNGDEFDFAIEYDEVISDNLNSFIANKFDQLIYTNTDNHTEIRVISVGKESDYVGKTVGELALSDESKFIAIVSSSGAITHNINNVLSPLDRILIQNTINYKDNE